VKHQLGILPKRIIADAGYGSEENYQYLENRARQLEMDMATIRNAHWE
jgi:hypothetical protein